jgi:hypothetical protein
VDGVIDTLLERLALEVNHGPVIVRRSLGYLAAARYGLTEDEMLDVLSADREGWKDFEEERNKHHDLLEQRLPVIVWSRLFHDLEPYLVERSGPGGTVACFYHSQLARQAAARFLGDGRRFRRPGSRGRIRRGHSARIVRNLVLWIQRQEHGRQLYSAGRTGARVTD